MNIMFTVQRRIRWTAARFAGYRHRRHFVFDACDHGEPSAVGSSVFGSVKEFFGLQTKAETSRTEADKGERTLVSTTFVISQAYGGGGGSTGTYLNDYVELKNISSSPQSLAGLSLMYGSATGQFASTATNVYALTGGTRSAGTILSCPII